MSKFVNDYEKTGLLAVDMVASIVSHYKRSTKPLRAINLSPKQFCQFVDWVKFNQTDEDAVKDVDQYSFEGVEVKMNSTLMGEKVYFEFWDSEKRIEA